jgi:hypothetical protein
VVIPVFGIRIIKRLTALALLCAVVAPVTAAQARSTSSATTFTTSTLVVGVNPSLSSAVFTVRTDTASKVSVMTGTDRQNMVGKVVATLKPSHTVTVTPLAPATSYFYSVTTTERNGRTSTKVGSFRTDGVRSATMSVKNGRFRLNGAPFFPIMGMMYTACPKQDVVIDNASMGVNVLDHWYTSNCYDSSKGIRRPVTGEELHSLLKNRVWWLERKDAPVAGLPEQLDFADNLFLELSAGDLWGCSPRGSSATTWYEKLKTSVAEQLAQETATVYFAAVTATGGIKSCFNARRFTAQFWTAFLAGAAGFEYDNQHGSREDGVEVKADVMAQAGIETNRLKTLYPVVLSGDERQVNSSQNAVKARGWSWGGSLYVIAVNTANRDVSAELKLGGTRNGAAKVLWERRSEAVRSGVLKEQFNAHEVHFYRL